MIAYKNIKNPISANVTDRQECQSSIISIAIMVYINIAYSCQMNYLIMVQYDTSDSRLRDRGFACFLLDISPHLAPHLNVDGRINSGCSPAYHRARTALTSENSNFVRFARSREEFLSHSNDSFVARTRARRRFRKSRV